MRDRLLGHELPLPVLLPHLLRKVDVRLPGKENSNSHGARPVHQIISMIKWIRTSRLSIHNSLSSPPAPRVRDRGVQGSGFRVQGSWFRVQGSERRVQGSGLSCPPPVPALSYSVDSHQFGEPGRFGAGQLTDVYRTPSMSTCGDAADGAATQSGSAHLGTLHKKRKEWSVNPSEAALGFSKRGQGARGPD